MYHNILKLGGGFCGEHAEALAYVLRGELNKDGFSYEVKLMAANADHAYLYLKVLLETGDNIYYRVDNWEQDFIKLNKQQYKSNADDKWGQHRVVDIWNNHDPLTTNPLRPEIVTSRIYPNPPKPKHVVSRAPVMPQPVIPGYVYRDTNTTSSCVSYLEAEKTSIDKLLTPPKPVILDIFDNADLPTDVPNSPVRDFFTSSYESLTNLASYFS